MRRLTFRSPQPGTRPPPAAREMTRGSLPAGEGAASGLQPGVFRDVRHPRPLGLTTADAAAPEYVDGRVVSASPERQRGGSPLTVSGLPTGRVTYPSLGTGAGSERRRRRAGDG